MRQIKNFSSYKMCSNGKVWDSKGNIIPPSPDGHGGMKVVMIDDSGVIRQKEPLKLYKDTYVIPDISNEPIVYHSEDIPYKGIVFTDDYNKLHETFLYDKNCGEVRYKSNGSIAGYLGNHGYLQTKYNYEVVYVHIIIVKMVLGDIVERYNAQIDHIDRNRANNSWSNIRIVSRQTNLQNKGKYKSNKSGVTGVWWSKGTSKWQVAITVNKQVIHLGVYNEIEDAIKVRKEAELKYKFHPSHGK